MSRFKHSERIPNDKIDWNDSDKIDLTGFTVEQLHLLIHNCNVFGIKDEIKQRYINKLNELESKLNDNKDEL